MALELRPNLAPEIWVPGDNNFKLANGDPGQLTGGTILVAGTVYLVKLKVPKTVPVANIWTYIVTAGATLTAGQNFNGLYDPSDGSLICKTGDLSTTWNGTTAKNAALIAEAGKSLIIPGSPTAFVYAALLANGTTPPTPLRFPTPLAGTVNMNLTAPDGWRAATADTGRTTLPATLGALTALSTAFWIGVS